MCWQGNGEVGACAGSAFHRHGFGVVHDQRGLVVADKAPRVHQFHRNTVNALAQYVAAAGLDFYVCPGTSSWNSLAGRTRNALLNLAAAAREGREAGARGLLITDWGDFGHLQPLPVSYLGFLAGAGFAWNTASAEDPLGLPILERMYKEYAPGAAPPAMAALAEKIRAADGFVFVTGEYNWGVQPGLKNLTDHFLEEWFWRPAAVASYSAGRFAGVRAATKWHATLAEMGMVVISSPLAVGQIAQALGEDGRSQGDGGAALDRAFPRFAADLEWWADAARAQRARADPPY